MNYLLESTVCITIFYGLYYLIFKRLTFIRLNRIYLLSSLVIGLSLPLISYQIKEVVKISVTVEYEETSLVPLVMNSSTPLISNTPIEETFDWNIIFQGIYVLGILFMVMKFSIIIYKLLKIKSISSGNDFISTQSKYANSSFFNLIFIDDSNLSENEINQILEHEKWHIRLLHSYDLLFVEILKIVFWFNPILWLYQRSLSEIHEYEVDTRMIQSYNPQLYAHLLLKLANPTTQSATHQFSRKPLTDRIHFLFTKQKSVPMKRLAYLSVLPILGAFFMAFSVEKVIDYQEVEESSKYFKIVRNTDYDGFPDLSVKENKVISTLYLNNGKIAFVINPNKVSEEAVNDAAKYFKDYGFTLKVLSKQLNATKKDLAKMEIGLTEDESNKKARLKNKVSAKTDLPEKFNFDLVKMRKKSGKRLDAIITILAVKSSGLHFVSSLAPPPPPPVPPLPPKNMPPEPPKPPLPPVKVGLNYRNNYAEDLIDRAFAEVFDGTRSTINVPYKNINYLIFEGNKLQRNIFISKVVTQKDWQSYLDFTNKDNYFSNEFRSKMIPDNWARVIVKSDKSPVEFVSFEQASEYCKWKTEFFNGQFKDKKYNYQQMVLFNSKNGKKYKFRLPNEKEWQTALSKKINRSTKFSSVGFCYILEKV